MNRFWTLLIVASGVSYWCFKDLKLRQRPTNEKLLRGLLLIKYETQVIRNKNPSKDARFNRRITTFQKANWQKNVSQRLPIDLIHSIAEYMHYDWMNLLGVIPKKPNRPFWCSLEELRRYLLLCATNGRVVRDHPTYDRPSIVENSAGDIVEINFDDLYLCDSALGDLSKLPPTLQRLNLCMNYLTMLDTKALPRGLKTLEVFGNKITDLDLQNLPRGLIHLHIGDNPLLNLNLTELPSGLKKLQLNAIGLKRVDLQSFPKELEYLDLSGNPLDRLNLNITWSQLPKLKKIYLRDLVDIKIELPSDPDVRLLVTRTLRGGFCVERKL